jgi:drug/metabolite transporter (DMT)-like permease
MGETLRKYWWVLLGLVLVLAGAAVLFTSDQPVGFGWFANSPLTEGDASVVPLSEWTGSVADLEASFQSQVDALRRGHLIGSIAVVGGLVVLAGGAAYRTGLRHAAGALANPDDGTPGAV